ncbi:sulfite oxidase [Salipaludibacillus aurantiacus]|uniref:Mo-co oxidoreductase dimerisation domain-containing protein n=1 Tax=Salipaludibacillus aurantiacus TaxID=1601833 RepID=A0A1H9TGE6_9BACI|nr:sulfite oxidase [Salipaludibacillus aurantiacus]SER96410.1 Mo-co oxidoreductase dimerisation domain-containing protein [Salipaludibacillus aurantiacus]
MPYRVNPYLITRSLHPENQETPIHFLRQPAIPEEYFFKRNHFFYPVPGQNSYQLQVKGKVTKSVNFHYDELQRMPSRKLKMVLECAGNKRSKFKPKVYGEQWEDGAISQGEWQGIPLNTLLAVTGVDPDVREVVFEGYDTGRRTDINEVVPFARSLPLQKALHPDTLIAYKYNGKPIPFKHGFPLRLIVPGWYGMASVKWLKTITLIDETFKGPFQTIDYVYYPDENSSLKAYPVSIINVNSIIQQPLDRSVIEQDAEHIIEGIAWTGKGDIKQVQVSFDKGKVWREAILTNTSSTAYGWTKWHINWKPPEIGEYTIQARAVDSAGRRQPEKALWNKKGYGFNAVSEINVKTE